MNDILDEVIISTAKRIGMYNTGKDVKGKYKNEWYNDESYKAKISLKKKFMMCKVINSGAKLKPYMTI